MKKFSAILLTLILVSIFSTTVFAQDFVSEYDRLEREYDRLIAKGKESKAEVKAYGEDTRIFNNEFKIYQNRKSKYSRQVEQYELDKRILESDIKDHNSSTIGKYLGLGYNSERDRLQARKDRLSLRYSQLIGQKGRLDGEKATFDFRREKLLERKRVVNEGIRDRNRRRHEFMDKLKEFKKRACPFFLSDPRYKKYSDDLECKYGE